MPVEEQSVKQLMEKPVEQQVGAFVFNIQHYSLHDGTGIRTIVFLKGCPLSCRWCCNPESQAFAPEVSFVAAKCIGRAQCGWCARACPRAVRFADAAGDAGAVAAAADAGAGVASGEDAAVANDTGAVTAGVSDVVPDAAVIDHAVLASCSAGERTAFVDACPARALKVEGTWKTVDEVMAVVRRDGAFFGRGGGGLTVSGGEPLVHQPFLSALLAAARAERISCAIETCGMAPYENLASAAKLLDEILFDVKSLDSARHRAWTGLGNETILGNLRRLCEEFPALPKLVRTPVIPGFNDTTEDVAAILAFLEQIGGRRAGIRYQPLPYHQFGRGKYAALGRAYPMGDAKLDKARFAEIEALVRASDLCRERA